MHVYISTKGSHVLNYTWKEEGLLYKKYTYVSTSQHPPAVEAAPWSTQRLDRNSSKDAVDRPFVMMSANCWDVGTCSTRT